MGLALLALAVPVHAEIPQQCSALPECKGLQGDCCPNKDKVQLDCCILAGVRIAAEDAEAKAKAAEKAATDAETAAKDAKDEAAAAKAKAEKTEKEATEAKAKAEKEEKDATAKGAQAKYIHDHIKEAKCQNNAGCKKAGLVGFCCPN